MPTGRSSRWLLGMRCGLLWCCLHLAVCAPARAQVTGGGRVAALGEAGTALPDDRWGDANPAAWSAHPQPGLEVFVSQAFGLSALRFGAARMRLTTPVAALTLGAESFGFDAFRRSRLLLGAARPLSFGSARALHAGASLHLEHLRIEGYGSTVHLGYTAGALAAVTPGLHAAFCLSHFPGVAQAAAPTLAVGLAYQVAPQLLLLADVASEPRHPAAYRLGTEWVALPVLALRLGFATAPARVTGGAGLRVAAWTADIAVQRHEVLGWSPAVALGWQW